MFASSQVGAIVRFVDIVPILMVISKAFSNEILALVSHKWLNWETYFASIKDSLVSYNGHLRFVVTEGFHAEQKFKEDDSN